MIPNWFKQQRLWTVIGLVLPLLLLLGGLTFGQPAAVQPATYSGSGGSAGTLGDRDGGQRAPLPMLPSAAGGGGVAQSSAAMAGTGAGLGTATMPSSPPTPQQNQPNAEQETAEITPDDPNAPRTAAPYVPPTEPRDLPGAGNASPAAPSAASLVFLKNQDLGSGTGNIIGETTSASLKNEVLETWNGYGAISKDNGSTWTYYNPATLFNWPGNDFGGFCCDQIAYYDQTHDVMFWILQYSPNGSGNNAIRVAWAQGAANLAAANFCWVNLTPQQLGSTDGPSGTNYDQPKFARSDNDIYLDIQRYGTKSGATIIRVAASAFTGACAGFTYDWYIPNVYSPGFTQRASSTMYFAGHATTSDLRVFAWPESVDHTGITSHDVTITTYYVNYPHSCPRTGGNSTSDWCQRRSFGGGWAHSDRIFTGWVTGGVITFMWDSTQGSGGSWGTKAYPFIDVARIKESDFSLISQPAMYNSNFAFVYPSAALNDRGHVAGTFMWGGGSHYESCGVFIWDDLTPNAPPPWEVYLNVRASNSDPSDTLSGDYLGTRRSDARPYTWNGACYALVGGGSGSYVHQYFLWFGRARDFVSLFLPLIRK
jgi:hypothetical protein